MHESHSSIYTTEVSIRILNNSVIKLKLITGSSTYSIFLRDMAGDRIPYSDGFKKKKKHIISSVYYVAFLNYCFSSFNIKPREALCRNSEYSSVFICFLCLVEVEFSVCF